jgi:predicted O-linked N-acetylglucosamine transferase (SPINDLY family)
MNYCLDDWRECLVGRPRSRDSIEHSMTPHIGQLFAAAIQHHQVGQLAQAESLYRQILASEPRHVEALRMLAFLGHQTGHNVQARELVARAISIEPARAESHLTLGIIFAAEGRIDEAIESYRRSIALDPRVPEAYNNLAGVLKEAGEVAQAIACYRTALSLRPDAHVASHLLYFLHWSPESTARQLLDEHLHWDQMYARPLMPTGRQTFENDPTPNRRLRVGYVSPDFYGHPIGRFLLPLLTHHDREQFEIICYSDVGRPDATTQQLRATASGWRETLGISDERLASLVRQDRIDVLVDLTLHADSNRLLAFARKPAPVQVSYLSYCSTSGMAAMDYRLTDPYLGPPGEGDSCYSERSVCLPRTWWCFQPDANAPEVQPLPALEAGGGRVTFGCFNHFAKASKPAVETWCRLLRASPHSVLRLHALPGSHRQRLRDVIAREGIDPQRLEFVGPLPLPQYFAQYHQIDIALDPFPYGGGTTTCEALWMGVPVVSLIGQTAVGRGGASILSNIGLPELLARSPEHYVEIAHSLANDLPALATLRATLRDRMRRSPLMDAPAFARDVESAFRGMWMKWCESKGLRN